MTLWPPKELLNLYLSGDKSLVIDIDDPDTSKFPLFKNAEKFECFLEPGDFIFIPALWFHNVTSLDFSVAVNVFWKHLDEEFYDKKDPYGNKDLIPGAKALQSLDNALKNVNQLPADYADFYFRRMIAVLQAKLDSININNLS